MKSKLKQMFNTLSSDEIKKLTLNFLSHLSVSTLLFYCPWFNFYVNLCDWLMLVLAARSLISLTHKLSSSHQLTSLLRNNLWTKIEYDIIFSSVWWIVWLVRTLINSCKYSFLHLHFIFRHFDRLLPWCKSRNKMGIFNFYLRLFVN